MFINKDSFNPILKSGVYGKEMGQVSSLLLPRTTNNR